MKRTLLIGCVLMTTLAAMAVPARPGTITHRQSDGTELTVRLVGDEYFHYYIDEATGQTMEMTDNGDLVPLTSSVLSARQRTSNERRIEANKARVERLQAVRMADTRKKVGSITPMSGQKKGLVILVNFQDVTFKSANNQQAFYNQFNQSGYSKNSHIGSVRDYFSDQSYGKLTIDFDVVGPVTVSQNMSYYGSNSGGSDVHPAEMIIEALALADSQCGVDYSRYDWNGNGYVDQVFIIYAGYNEAQGAPANTIWPHEWTLSAANYYNDGSGKKYYDGKWIDTYACTSELCSYSGSTMDGIGTACHEFSHCLGYPDVYDTNNSTNGDAWGMDTFDLMDYGSYSGPNGHGEVPCGYSAYERWVAGWIEPAVLSGPRTVTDLPNIGDIPAEGDNAPRAYVAYISGSNAQGEYNLFENRQSSRWFRYSRNYTAGHGLFISYVNYDSYSWTQNKVNIDAFNQHLTYVAADKSYSYSSASQFSHDYFPAGATSCSTTSHGNYYYGALPVTEITESGGRISFKYDGGFDDTGERFTITYHDCGSTSAWTQHSFKQEATLPSTTGNFADWVGIGWATYEIPAPRPETGVTILYSGNSYEPTVDVDLYAVYRNDDYMVTTAPVNADYTVTTSVNGATTTWTQTAGNRTFTFPTAAAPSGWTFEGWSTTELERTSNRPADLIAAGTTLVPTANQTYYAVFSMVPTGDGSDGLFRLVDSPTAGNEYVIATANTAGSAYAIDAANVPATAATAMSGTSVTIVDNGGAAIATAPSTAIWTASYTNSKLHLQCGSTYLKINGSGFAKSSDASDLYWSDSYGLYGKSGKGTTSYYVRPGTGSTITCNTTSGNATSRVYLFERGGSVTYYSTSAVAPDFTVTFNPGSGTCTTATFTQAGDVRSLTLPTASSNVVGWSFVGWATKQVALTTTAPAVMTAGTAYTPVANVTLYAVYTATSHNGAVATTHYCTNPTSVPVDIFYTVTFNAGNGTCALGTFTQTATAGSLTLPTAACSVAGWSFAGWATGAVEQTATAPTLLTAGAEYAPEANITLYAVYSATIFTGGSMVTYYATNPSAELIDEFFTVTFNAGSGTCTTPGFTQTASQSSLSLPSATAPEGWTFYGWATSAVAETAEAPASLAAGYQYTPAANLTLYAVYTNGKAYITDTTHYVGWGGDADPEFFFPHMARMGEPFTAPTLTTDSDGPLTFTSSDTSVAIVDAQTGAVTLVGPGVTIITATQAETADFSASTARYAIKVVE